MKTLKRIKLRVRLAAILSLIAAGFQPASVHADDYLWNGASIITNDWNDPFNWNTVSLPPSNGTARVLFGEVFGAQHVFADLAGNWSIDELWFEDAEAYTLESTTNHKLFLKRLTCLAGAQHVILHGLEPSAAGTWAIHGDLRVSGPLTGPFNMTKAGAGILRLSGNNSGWLGDLNINDGTVRFLGGDNLSDATDVTLNQASQFSPCILDLNNTAESFGGLAGNGSVTLGAGDMEVGRSGLSTTFSGTIGGTGKVIKSGGATWTLEGDQTFTGEMVVSQGTLKLANGGSLENGNAFLTLGGAATQGTFSGSTNRPVNLAPGGGRVDCPTGINLNFSNAISGPGKLTKIGGGGLSLEGDNTAMSGDVDILAGELYFFDDNGLSFASTVTVAANARLNANFKNLTCKRLLGDGEVAFAPPGGSLHTGLDNADFTFGGTFSGPGKLRKAGTGALSLTGSASSGAQLKVETGKAILNGPGGFSAFDVQAGATLQVGTGGTTGTLNDQPVALNGSLALNRSDDLTIGSPLSGTGSVTQLTSAELQLSNASNSYSGGTRIENGTLRIENIAAAGAASPIGTGGLTIGSFTTSGNLEITTPDPFTTNRPIALGSRGGTIDILSPTADVALDGVISGTVITQSGLFKNGPGSLALRAANTFNAKLAINDGMLRLAGGDNRLPAATMVSVANVAGAGLILDHVNQTIRELTGGGAAGGGVKILGADKTLTISQGFQATATYMGVISGDGKLKIKSAQNANARMILGNNCTSSGLTSVEIGSTLQLGGPGLSNGSVAGPIFLDIGGRVEVSRTTEYTLSNAISGPGALRFSGSGTIHLTGDHSARSGRTEIMGGIVEATSETLGAASDANLLQIGNGTLRAPSDMVLPAARPVQLTGAAQIDTNGHAVQIDGDLAGTGSLTKMGAGTLTLPRSSLLTGGVIVAGGTLLVTNTTGSATGNQGVTVNNGATLGGTGFINGFDLPNTKILTGGTISPGAGVGTLTVSNGLRLSNGAKLNIDLGTGGSDLVRVTSSGYFNDGSVTVNITNAGGLAPGQTYTIIDFAGATPFGVDAADFVVGTGLVGGTFSIVGSTVRITTTGNPACFVDSDSDRTVDCEDGCPNDPNMIAPGQCGCGMSDQDGDGDGTSDCNDACLNDPLKIAPGVCGCGVPDTDTDSDGAPDCNDGCPNDPNKTSEGICGCGVSDTDSDSDGTMDCHDGCPSDPLKVSAGACGCGVSDLDSDVDGSADCVDNCPSVSNSNQADTDLDQIGNACDNCPRRFNPDQVDSNGNGKGDACDVPPVNTALEVPDSPPGSIRSGRKQQSALDQGMQPCGVGTGMGVASAALGLIGARGRRRR